jgi:hypothetical protein
MIFLNALGFLDLLLRTKDTQLVPIEFVHTLTVSRSLLILLPGAVVSLFDAKNLLARDYQFNPDPSAL